jgi:hypothetical protein
MSFLFFAQDHPSQKKKIPLQIDMHLPASALIHEVARAPRIFLEKLSVEYVDRLWPQDGLNRSCRDNFIREGTCLVAVSIGQGKKWRKGRETPPAPFYFDVCVLYWLFYLPFTASIFFTPRHLIPASPFPPLFSSRPVVSLQGRVQRDDGVYACLSSRK